MTTWKLRLIESILLGAGLATAIIFVATQAAGEWIAPAFFLPFQGATLLSGNSHEPPPWLFHAVLFLQSFVVVLALGWVMGRYRRRAPKA